MSFASDKLLKVRGFLARLRRDTKGNTLALVGAALIPLSAMIGSGVDMSRSYMAKTRLQNACDSAALAGRRVLIADTLDANVIAEARRYFNFNFQQGMYGTAPFVVGVTRPATGTVRVTANTTIPTTIMRLFGFEALPIAITCEASMNFVNTDVMLVLDVTGSMNSFIGGERKIDSLRAAVMALYDELAPIQTQLESNGLRLRYGVVPYSTTVNVGDLIYAASPAYIADSAEYETRVALYDTPVFEDVPGSADPPVTQVYGSSISQNDCDKYGRNVDFSGFTHSPWTGTGPPTGYWRRTFSNNEATGVDWGWSGASDTGGNTRSCRRRYVHIDTRVDNYVFTSWSYEPEDLDVHNFKTGAAVTYATASNGSVEIPGRYDMIELAAAGTGVSTTTATWSGCIQERATVNTITSASGYTIPSGAYDLNINLLPTTNPTRWSPMWRSLVYRRTAGTAAQPAGNSMSSAACPAEARGLQAWTRGNMQSYVNGLSPTGNTYHDSGMIWGARLISNAGIFAASPDEYNGMPVSRHIIFMSDGLMEPADDVYAMYGIEQNSQHIAGMNDPGSGANSELASRHNQRFKMICNAAKAENTSIWVIAFGLSLTPEMTECASNANQASTAANRAALIARFREIGSQIGALRLTL